MIRITAKREGYRRAGIAHSKTPTEHADDRFSKAGLAQLQADPNLTVETVEGKENKAAAKPNVGETVKLVEACTTLAELATLAEGETRKGVLEAIGKRGDELATAADKPGQE